MADEIDVSKTTSGEHSCAENPLKVLIVEDDRTAALVVKMILLKCGWQTAIAKDGQAAMEMARHLTPDVILLDYELPDTTGLELLRELRSQPQTAEMAVIALTGHACVDIQRDMLLAGANGVCTKPVSRATLLQSIRQAALPQVEQPNI